MCLLRRVLALTERQCSSIRTSTKLGAAATPRPASATPVNANEPKAPSRSELGGLPAALAAAASRWLRADASTSAFSRDEHAAKLRSVKDMSWSFAMRAYTDAFPSWKRPTDARSLQQFKGGTYISVGIE